MPSADALEAMTEAELDRESGNNAAFETHTALKARLGIQ